MTRWTDTLLNEKRLVGDPEVDDLVSKYFAGAGPDAPGQVAATLYGSADPTDHLPEDLRHLTAPAPENVWDFEEGGVERGQKFFRQQGPEIFLVLACYSLPAAYAAHRGVRVLRRTGRLLHDPALRLVDTANILTKVMAPHALGPDHPGVRAARKLRLLHAVIRYRILHDPDHRWDPLSTSGGDDRIPLGLPINQEDLAGTLTTFSYAILDGLHHLGIAVEPEVRQAYLDTWAGIGRILGVELIPTDFDDARALAERIHVRQHGPSRDGREMTAALLEMIEGYLPFILRPFPDAMMRFFLQKYPGVADYIGVPNYPAYVPLVHGFALVNRVANRWVMSHTTTRRLFRHLSFEFIRMILDVARAHDREDFQIPDELTKQWLSERAGAS